MLSVAGYPRNFLREYKDDIMELLWRTDRAMTEGVATHVIPEFADGHDGMRKDISLYKRDGTRRWPFFVLYYYGAVMYNSDRGYKPGQQAVGGFDTWH